MKKSKTKKFKVIQIGELNLGGGWFHHILLSPDGECWQIARLRSEQSEGEVVFGDWGIGDVIEFSMKMKTSLGDRLVMPDFEEMGVASPVKIDLAHPYESILKWWGKNEADRYSSPTGRAERLLRPSVTFTADDFLATMTDTAETKAVIANQFVRFFESFFRWEFFTDSLYEFLYKNFSFLAGQKTREECYSFWFTKAGRRLDFAQRITGQVFIEEATKSWSDVKKVLQKWLINEKLNKLSKTKNTADTVQERAELLRLLRKYGIPDEFRM